VRIKKTLSNWLNNRHIFIIQNEEDFSEKATYNFTYARIAFFAFLAFLVVLTLSFYLVNTFLAKWFDPRFADQETRKELVSMRLSLDSLENQLDLRDQYIQGIRSILDGDVSENDERTEQTTGAGVQLQQTDDAETIDSLFKSEFERGGDFYLGESLDNLELGQSYFFSPLSGFISSAFDPQNDHFGIDVVSKKDEPIKVIADGTIIFASWTQDAGNVIAIQHQGNLISVYKHNSALLKNVGDFVSAGDIIAIIGNTGELSSGPHLHLELWYNGNAVNPEEFISF
jgi:murein DD-endopeptidase MepM/ murein hydrolase activator NlpD